MNNQKVILITGTSSGFGLLTAARLAGQGHFVWATMRDLARKGPLEEALAIRQAQAFIRELDVTRPSSIKNVVEEIQKTHAHIDVLVNNAGYGIGGFFEDLSEEEIRAQMNTNFFGVQNVCREVIPLMRSRSEGQIINISSIAGRIGTPVLGAYNASKWALEGFSESLYYELSLWGISVVLVEPGFYPTNIFSREADYARNSTNLQSPYFSFSQRIKDLAARTVKKLKRNPEDVAALIERIIHTPRPKLRYVSDFSSWCRVMAQKILPPPVMAGIFRRLVHANR